MWSDDIHYYRYLNLNKNSILIKSLKEYQSIQKLHKSIKNQVFFLVIPF